MGKPNSRKRRKPRSQRASCNRSYIRPHWKVNGASQERTWNFGVQRAMDSAADREVNR